MKKKNYSFVFLYTIGSILIVAGHCQNGGIDLAFNFFTPYSFHLALFVFSSGYFYKSKVENNVIDYIWKKVKKLIIPMYIINFLFGLFVLFTKKFGFQIGSDFTLYNLLVAPLNSGHQFVYNMCFWFVVPLFMVEVFNVLLRKQLKKIEFYDEYTYIKIYFVMGIFSLFLSHYGYNRGNMLIVLRFLYFLPYYGLGILYKENLEKFDHLDHMKYFGILFLVQIFLITYHKKIPSYAPAWLDFEGQLILPYIESILGIAFWLRISKILEKYTQNNKIINCISEHSYAIMAYQFIGFFVVKLLFAIISRNWEGMFSSFDVEAFKTDIWYYYVPYGLSQWLILYLFAGIFIPIGIDKIITRIKNRIRNRMEELY